ncbi:hypothetical protein LCGC14_2590450 [marine sediment metagenome]|uniref:Uncharacterized protein n=1 Tax=marine sediment metagenome TaxID=412755 RepID=A0A0F9AZP6_9ZZZZ
MAKCKECQATQDRHRQLGLSWGEILDYTMHVLRKHSVTVGVNVGLRESNV